MEHPLDSSPLPADHFRRHAARVRALARDATTPAIKKRLEDVALAYERIADRFDENGSAQAESLSAEQYNVGQSKT
jgi:hypothetical protein